MFSDEAQAFRSGRIGIRHSGWVRYPGEPADFPPLIGERRADVAVVGAGLAGSALALHLAEGGVETVLLDAQEPGWGASGRNAGHVVTHREILAPLRRLPDRGEAFLDLWRREIGLTFGLVAKHNIACDAVRGGYMKVAATPRHAALAHRHAEEFATLGLPVRFADRAEVAAFTGSHAFHAGALDEAGGRINPYWFTRGLATAARRAGATVHGHSPVAKVDRVGTRWRVATDRGVASAERVVVCTGAYGDITGWPEVRESWCPLLAYVIATEPLPEDVRRAILPSGGICAQLPHGLNPFLVDGLGRLFTASLPGLRAEDFRQIAAQQRRWLDRTFPAMRGRPLGIDSYWTGTVAYSIDQLPRISELGPGLLMLNGFSSEGNVPAPMLAKHLAEKLLSGRLDELALPLRQARSVRWRGRYEFILRRLLIPLQNAAQRLGIIA